MLTETELEAPQSAPTRGRSAVEFLLVGGGTLLVLPALYLLRQQLGLDQAEYAIGFLMFHLAVIINNPHFAVTYLLFYGDARRHALASGTKRAQLLRYVFAGGVVPLALVVWLACALIDHTAVRLGLLIQLMFVLVGWHYVKQGFGVLSVLSQRRGARYTPRERHVILAHCIAGWLCARTNPRDPGKASVLDDVLYTSLPHPAGLDRLTAALFALSGVALVVVLLQKRHREGRFPPLVPLFGLLITIWIWLVFSRLDPLLAYVIPALHSLQYLYFVWLLKTNQARAEQDAPQLRAVKWAFIVPLLCAVALGWLLFRGIPSLLDDFLVLSDSLDPLGVTPYLAAIGTALNIHHYFMDAVIWRRDNPATRHLLQP